MGEVLTELDFTNSSAYKAVAQTGFSHHAALKCFQAERPHLGSSSAAMKEARETWWALMTTTWNTKTLLSFMA